MIQLFFLITTLSAYQIWQVTDVHYDANYKPNTDLSTYCRSGNGTARPFGDYNCDTTYEVLSSIPPFIKMHSSDKNKNKILLYNGDIIPRHVEYDTFDYIAEGLDNATIFLNSFEDFEVIPMLGNHDAIPENHLNETTTFVYEYAAKKWRKWLPESAIKTFRKGGYYTKRIRNTGSENRMINDNKNDNFNNNNNDNKNVKDEEAYVIVLNTVLYYTHNPTVADGTDPCDQFVWLEETLENYRRGKKNVLIAAHICPGVSERYNWTDQMYGQYDSRLINLIASYDDVVIGMVCGHLHLDTFRILESDDRKHTVIGYLSPSLDAYLSVNPSLRIYDIKGKVVQNYINYKVDLEGERVEWTKTYNFKEEYGYDDCSTESMKQFASDMHDDRNLHDIWYKHLRADTDDYTCDDKCWNNNLCAIEHPRTSERDQCYKF